MSSHTAARLRIAILLIVVLDLQTALGNDLRVFGVAPDLMVLLSICAGLAGGMEAGAVVGFSAGLLVDFFLVSTPLGLSALTYCLIGALVGWLRAGVLPDRVLVIPLGVVAGTVAAVLLFVALGDVLGQSQLVGAGRSWLVKVVVVEAAWSLVLSLPVAWLYARAARGSAGAARLGMTLALPRAREKLLGVR